MKIKRKEKNMN